MNEITKHLDEIMELLNRVRKDPLTEKQEMELNGIEVRLEFIRQEIETLMKNGQ